MMLKGSWKKSQKESEKRVRNCNANGRSLTKGCEVSGRPKSFTPSKRGIYQGKGGSMQGTLDQYAGGFGGRQEQVGLEDRSHCVMSCAEYCWVSQLPGMSWGMRNDCTVCVYAAWTCRLGATSVFNTRRCTI